VSRSVEQNLHTGFSFPNPLSESDELQCWVCSKILLLLLMRFDGHFRTNQQTAAMFTSVPSPLHLPAPFRLEIENTNYKRLIGSQPHSHKPFTPILVFLSQMARVWNKILWQLAHFRHPWRILKTDCTRQVITRTLSKINKRSSVCERMLVDST
jgi:hypothetical protein